MSKALGTEVSAKGAGELSRPPVIALGVGMTLLQVLTLFAKAGVRSYAVCPEGDFVRYSRWYHRLPLKRDGLSPANLAQALEELPFERAVLMPCSDDWVEAVAALSSCPGRGFLSSMPSREIAATMVNKWRFAQALDEAGVPHPPTRLISSFAELASVPAAKFGEVFLKPLHSLPFCRRHRAKGFRPQDREQALRIMRDKEFPILLQEFIPGPPTAGYFLEGFVDQGGRICGMLARQRLRMFPPELGNSSLSVSVPLAAAQAAEQSLRRLLAFLHYRGIFSAEFKYDQRDRLFKLFEINARAWWYVEFAAHCGLDVCAMAYRDALGLPVEPVREYQVGRRCLYLADDIHAWWRQRRQGVSLWSWARPWFGAMHTPFHWNDPGPALAFPASALRQRREYRRRTPSARPEENLGANRA
jgi:D-aspartate ligase